MNIDVSSGRTREPAGTDLVPLILGEEKGEKIFLILHSEGRTSGKETLQEESAAILEQAVLGGDGDAYTRLEGALKELNGLFRGLLLSGAVRDIHALVGVFEEDGMLHLSHAGRAEAYLIREGTTAQITEYSRGKPVPSFIHIASGPLEGRDHVILSTQRLLRTFTPAQLAQIVVRGGDILKDIVSELSGEKEVACLLHIAVHANRQTSLDEKERPRGRDLIAKGSRTLRGNKSAMSFLSALPSLPSMPRMSLKLPAMMKKKERGGGNSILKRIGEFGTSFMSDLRDPKRKRRAHLLLLASAVGLFLIFWVMIQLSLLSQNSQSREELKTLVEQIDTDIKTAENRQLTGDNDSANAILNRAEDRAKQVMENESGLYRGEALNLLDRIRQKKEEMNNIVRIPPRLVVNLSAKNSNIEAQGFMGLADGEFLIYDRQQMYRVLLNAVDDPVKLDNQELILDGTVFPRFQTRVFMTTGNSLLEVINGEPTVMKTEDTAGWMSGTDIKTYLRYLYLLSPEKNQIYKYERLNNRYGPASEYNVNGNLKGAIDMTIDGDLYILKDDGQVVKLLRGEQKPFTIRNLPEGALTGMTKVFKSSPTGNIYFLNPKEGKIVVATSDTDLGESSYIRQYVLESQDLGTLKDMYVDPDDARLYILDDKRLYSIDLQAPTSSTQGTDMTQ